MLIIPFPSHPLPPTTHHLALHPTDKHLLSKSQKQPLVCLCTFGLVENSTKSELASIVHYVKIFFSSNKYWLSTFCSFIHEGTKAQRNYVTCQWSSYGPQTEELVLEPRPNLVPIPRKAEDDPLSCRSPQTNWKLELTPMTQKQKHPRGRREAEKDGRSKGQMKPLPGRTWF